MDLFRASCGVVSAIKNVTCNDGAGAALTIGDLKLGSGGKAGVLIVTGIDVSERESVNVMRGFSEFTHVFAFGAMPGSITVSVLGFVKPCPDYEGQGLEQLFDAYYANRAFKAKEKATLTLANSLAFRGYVEGINLTSMDAEKGIFTGRVAIISPTVQGA